MAITLTISDELWKSLNIQKNAGESFDNLIKRLINSGDKELSTENQNLKSKINQIKNLVQ